MHSSVKVQQRNERLAKMRATLSVNPLFTNKTNTLQQKHQKNKTRRGSTSYTSKQMTISKEWDIQQIQDLQMDKKFYSLFKDKYQLISKIGEGANGVVRKCKEKQSNQMAAVKTFKLDQEHFLYLKRNFIDIKNLKNENIIKYKALFFQKQNQTCHLVMEYQPLPNLLHLKYKQQEFLKNIVYQMLKTIEFLHENNICHRDIKPENILFDEATQKIKFIDFGISKNFMDRGRRKDMLTNTGTLYYKAPQIFQGGGYDQSVDMWALGVTIYKLMTGKTPFQSEYVSVTIENIKKGQIPHHEVLNKFSKTPRNLISRFLKPKKERLTAKEALKDFWFIDIITKKNEQDTLAQSMSVNARNNFSFLQDLNGGSGKLTLNHSNYTQGKSKKIIVPPKSIKEIMNIAQEESMIYGQDQQINTKI